MIVFASACRFWIFPLLTWKRFEPSWKPAYMPHNAYRVWQTLNELGLNKD